MLGASAARLFDLTAQSFSRPMHADGGIFRGNSRLLRQVAELSVIEIDQAQRIAVFGFQIVEQAGNTVADLLPQCRIGFLALAELSAPGFQSPSRGGAMTVVIDQGVTEDSIKPGNYLFILDL
jgi:hypothetical protein